ncbi:hypothetical protein A4A49_37730 [Nicotiana attenuata]|uniref:Uncharacterized protein n=1 Tax=Nicotiana attenuata TaxID=49451 RepID=A0A314LAT6_NICAT|nr:hypothetical protein A4A49_37730 [Nicotiana attenuata]
MKPKRRPTFPLLQYFVDEHLSTTATTRRIRCVNELSDWSTDAILEPHKECTRTTDAIEAQFPTKYAYHVAPSDAANDKDDSSIIQLLGLFFTPASRTWKNANISVEVAVMIDYREVLQILSMVTMLDLF